MFNLTTIYNSQNAEAQCCEKADGRSRERIVSTSHYSTDKSGSSGYYSSRVCSTSSVEDHIYSEPAIDVIHPLKQLTLPIEPTLQEHKSQTTELETGENYYNAEFDGASKINEELQSLKNSIRNLDKHLRNYSGLNRITLSRLSEISNPGPNESVVYDDVGTISIYDKSRASRAMPTIMEGNDGGHSSLRSRLSWTEDVDDSLTDIDLDSFRLVNEVARKSTKRNEKVKKTAGIDSPTFDKTKVLDEEVIENNYKCSKYINSCPEDAYNVESLVGSMASHGVSTPRNDNERKGLGFFLKRYEDQLHFQSTKDILEDIRSKVNALKTSTTELNCHPGESQEIGIDSQPTLHTTIPKDLEHYIAILKHELEAYLSLMNHSNEMEIKQLCMGLGNNQKVLTITKAFERRKSLASDNSNSLSYEPLRSSSYNTLPYAYTHEHSSSTITTIASSDPNFHLKRKSQTKHSEYNASQRFSSLRHGRHFVEEHRDDIVGCATTNGQLKALPTATQLQKNLSLQRPMLDKRNREDNGNDKTSILEWHMNKPSIWEQYYGTNRKNQTLTGKRGQLIKNGSSILSYPSSRPESDFTLDLPRAEQLRIKMDKEKKFRHRCRILTTFLSLVFFLLTVMVVSLILTRGKRMFGSML
ncbi:unnamed protein product [Hermetia illucens]|uniref:Uncharacterized protein n=2 Tax=Hermetia illucens TaxID=343691 RepID=A0A7R8Z0N8_HERIL|nr:unnamed protein product [Hermetia illucens]